MVWHVLMAAAGMACDDTRFAKISVSAGEVRHGRMCHVVDMVAHNTHKHGRHAAFLCCLKNYATAQHVLVPFFCVVGTACGSTGSARKASLTATDRSRAAHHHV